MESPDDIFLNAREITDTVAQAAYLNKACGNDAALRARVEDMLHDARKADEFFGPQGTALVGPGAKPGDEEMESVIGRYKLLQKIGEGGMGVVYMAEQRSPVVRKVALKIIRLGMDTKQVVARFEAERQALALMDHPNIAKVLDGGETEAGRPYFVMELVQGLPITQFCDNINLPTSERISLFLDVCSAVQHAHQKGIIHRDLKPSNILVTLHGDKPVPKVIDFGVAKATQGRLTEKTVFTQFQQFIGTPAYMSPEQTSLSGLDVDTRSDIYSLGVLLYELLTGKTPFDATELLKVGLDHMRQVIREQEPPKPSTRLSTMQGKDLTATAKHRQTEPPKLIHLVRGDLDWIVMKCLEKDRARRYETANGLATDLHRHLKDEPVLARPPSALYRVQKAMRRHKTAFAAALIIATTLVLAAAVSTWQAIRATRAERKAQEQANAAKAVKDFVVTQLLFPANPTTDPVFDPNKQGLLERIALALDNKLTNQALGDIERRGQQLDADQLGGLTNQPVIEAEIRSALGQGFGWLRDYERAVAQHERVLEIRRRHLGSDHTETLHTAARVAYAYLRLNRLDEAETLLDSTIAAGRAAKGGTSTGLGVALMVQGDLRRLQGRFAEALTNFQAAVTMMKQNAGEEYSDIGATLSNIARVTESLGQTNEAALRWDEAVRHNKRLYGVQYPTTVGALSGQAQFFLRSGRTAEGLKILEELIPSCRAMFGTNSLDTTQAQLRFARALQRAGQTERAAELYARLPGGLSKFINIDSTLDDYKSIGYFFVTQRRYADARAAFEPLHQSLKTNRLVRPAQLSSLVEATAATHGWMAAAEVCRTNFDEFPHDGDLWQIKTAVFAYANDDEWRDRAALHALDLASNSTNRDEQIALAAAVSLGRSELAQDQIQATELLRQKLETLDSTNVERRVQIGVAIVGLQIRLGQYQDALVTLGKVPNQRPSSDRATLSLLKSLCLWRLQKVDEAREALDHGESAISSLISELPKGAENFLGENERRALLLHREVLAIVGSR